MVFHFVETHQIERQIRDWILLTSIALNDIFFCITLRKFNLIEEFSAKSKGCIENEKKNNNISHFCS